MVRLCYYHMVISEDLKLMSMQGCSYGCGLSLMNSDIATVMPH
jgi:hypothetical protein